MDLISTTADNRQKDYSRIPSGDGEKHDMKIMFQSWKPLIERTMEREHRELASTSYGLKFQLAVRVVFRKYEYNDRGEIERIVENKPYFLSNSERYDTNTIRERLNVMFHQINERFETFVNAGSGFFLHLIEEQKLHVYVYRLLMGGGHNTVHLPGWVQRKRACINVKCDDGFCFLYCCVLSLYPFLYSNGRVESYKTLQKYLVHLKRSSKTHYPMRLKNVPAFERDNTFFSINIVGIEGQTIVPLYQSVNKARQCVYLLLYKNHYFYVSSLSRLLANQKNARNKILYCNHCLSGFRGEKSLRLHSLICRQSSQLLLLPPKDRRTISFRDFKAMFSLPFIIYYDIEVMLVPKGVVHDHQPISVCVYTKCSNDFYSHGPVVYTGTTCISRFMNHLRREDKRISHILKNVNHPLQANAEDIQRFHSATVCDVCESPFSKTNKKCMDHDHLNDSVDSNVRFVLCNTCNITYGKTAQYTPVVAHNAMRYDILHILGHFDKGVNVLAKNSEQFLSLKWRKFVFIDSMNFLQGSLDTLANKIPYSDLRPYLEKISTNDDLLSLLIKKTPFPYDYLDSETKLCDTRLPCASYFYNKLTETAITKEEYARAQQVWEKAHCSTLKDYMELYVMLDVVLLACVFEKYRVSTLTHFGLDPAHFVSTPSMCYNAMLKLTRVKLDMLPSTEMYLFFTSSIRGGLSGTAVRYAESNVHTAPDYNPNKPMSAILGFDANNLYGHSLSQSLPVKDFAWMTPEELRAFDIHSVPTDGSTGYFLEVDLEYPPHLHDKHNNLPLAPEKRKVKAHDWSPYTRSVGLKVGEKGENLKLMNTLHDKPHYVLHFEALRLYLRLGLRLKAIHRGVKFAQEKFLASYITINNEARKKASTDFEIALYKLYNNCIYGKMMYNVFNQVNMELVFDEKRFLKLVALPNFFTSHIISPSVTCVGRKPFKIKCDKPIYVGASVLDLSKLHMYRFWYDYLLPTYFNSGLSLLYMDTDSFYILVENRIDYLMDIKKHERYFDRSCYPRTHFLYSKKRERELGAMKDIHSGAHVVSFCALRSKMYSILTEKGSENKAKGIVRHALSRYNFFTYKHCLKSMDYTSISFTQIDRHHHRLSTISTNKRALSCFDDKRYYLPCGVHSYAYGHYKIAARPDLPCSLCPHSTFVS